MDPLLSILPLPVWNIELHVIKHAKNYKQAGKTRPASLTDHMTL